MIESSWLMSMKGNYPSLAEMEDNFIPTPEESEAFVKTWLCEGIPFVYLDCPVVFNYARLTLASALFVQHRDIGITGSARLGYSLNPKKFGAEFVSAELAPSRYKGSDIDLFLISEGWFGRLNDEADRFISDYKQELISPNGSSQKYFWDNNVEILPKNRRAGFVQSDRVPTYYTYPAFQEIGDKAYRFVFNVNRWSGVDISHKATIRVYKDWNSAIRQLSLNLRSAIINRKTDSRL